MSMESNQAAARQARRFLEEHIRNDWAYPTPPPPLSAPDEEVCIAYDFRERYYGDSDSDALCDALTEDTPVPYKFDSPDSIGDTIAHTCDVRARRRQAQLALEIQENEGLRIWVERRDRWTGVASVRKYGAPRHARTIESVIPATSTIPAVPAMSKCASGICDIVPVAPRLLHTNPIRASITSCTYLDIFHKVVMSGRTPSVPINLVDMTQALVLGWKETDEWPPRLGCPDPLVGKKPATMAEGPQLRR